MIKHSAAYTAYMKSDAWRKRKQQLYAKRGYACERCGVEGDPVEVHHLTYARLCHELDEDLQVVCKKCHKIADKERRELEERLKFQQRFEAWAREWYGLLWRLRNQDKLIEEFYEWEKNGKPERLTEWIVM